MPDVPGVTDAAAGGPPGGGVLPPVTSSELRVASGRQGDLVAEAINRREREGKKPQRPRKKKDDRLPDGDYTLEDFRRMFGDDEDDDDEGTLQEGVVVVDKHDPTDGAKLASRMLSKMGRPGR